MIGGLMPPPIIISMPGSKSITNRALLLAAMAGGKTKLKNMLESDDTKYMRKNLKVMEKGNPKNPLYCGNAGTTLRFLAAYAATKPFETILTGDARMQKRPIEDLLIALRTLGVRAESLKKNGCPPVKIKGPILGGTVTVPGNISSQFVSGLLMVVPLSEKKTILKITGKILSQPYIEMTLRIMEDFGVKVIRRGSRTFIIHPQKYRPLKNYKIEGDASSATYFWGISALTGLPIHISNIPKNSIQGDVRFLEILKKMGSFPFKPINENLKDMPDAGLTVAALCAFAKGISTLRGLENLRVKESDRIKAMALELRKIGCKVIELKDGWKIYGNPGNLHGARIKTYNDHRIAMCFGMLKSRINGLTIENPSCVKKSYPNFWKDLQKTLFFIKQCSSNIVLTGLRGSGKSTLGKMLAKYLHKKFIDLDHEIEKKEKMGIPMIVNVRGWKYFRKLERQAVKNITSLHDAVIACGGGAVMDNENVKILKQNGKITLLKVSLSALKKRILKDNKRPPLFLEKNILEEISHIWNIRKKQYYKVADKIVVLNSQSLKVNFNKLLTNIKNIF